MKKIIIALIMLVILTTTIFAYGGGGGGGNIGVYKDLKKDMIDEWKGKTKMFIENSRINNHTINLSGNVIYRINFILNKNQRLTFALSEFLEKKEYEGYETEFTYGIVVSNDVDYDYFVIWFDTNYESPIIIHDNGFGVVEYLTPIRDNNIWKIVSRSASDFTIAKKVDKTSNNYEAEQKIIEPTIIIKDEPKENIEKDPTVVNNDTKQEDTKIEEKNQQINLFFNIVLGILSIVFILVGYFFIVENLKKQKQNKTKENKKENF